MLLSHTGVLELRLAQGTHIISVLSQTGAVGFRLAQLVEEELEEELLELSADEEEELEEEELEVATKLAVAVIFALTP